MRALLRAFVLLAVLFLPVVCGAAEPVLQSIELDSGDTLVFCGDSITHQCLYTQYVEDFFYTRYPERKIRFHNAGIGGDKAFDALMRFDRDIAAYKPKYVTVLLGMNDGTYANFDQAVFDTYERDMTELLDKLEGITEGHRIYTDLVAQAVRQMAKDARPVDHGPKLKTAFVDDHWQAAKMVPVTASMLSGEWKQLAPDSPLAKRFGNRMGTLWESTQPGSRLSFKFRGSTARLYDLLGPDGGQVIITVDGRTRPKPVPRFDSYCTYHRIATLSVAEGLDPDHVHTVTVEIHPEQPDRSPVAFRLKDPAVELKSPKYQGTNVRFSKILVLGDVVE